MDKNQSIVNVDAEKVTTDLANSTISNTANDLKENADVSTFPMPRTLPLRPPPDYARLRKENPISKAKIWDGSLVWLVTRHHDVSKALTDPHFSKVRTHPGFPETGPGGKAAAHAGKPTFVDMDPPEHTRHRGMVEQDFTKEKAEEMRPKIQQIADKILDEMLTKAQPVDLLASFALPVPTLVIYHMLGVPYEDHEFLDTCNAIRTNGSATSAESARASKDLMDYLARLVDKKTQNPTNDIISRLAIEQVQTSKLTHDELVAMSFLLLVAGNATTANMIALGTLTLLQHPDQLAELRRDPSLIKNAVEEILRYVTGSQFATRRLALEDVEIGGQIIKKGEGVWALNASANEDEDVFSNATRFDIHRQPNPHLAFGDGIHVCIAQDLARVEIQIAIETLIRRLPNLQLAVPADELQYVTIPKRDFGVAALPVKW
ncbi:unnamed protein product [Rotaria sordida]|uniref:Cytochrome P450 n=2 Tax=Rotaria sordida TaxID=392033 RepID=A0A814CC55_9BILA|nr:unnamed protein product [Rotaria sordida]